MVRKPTTNGKTNKSHLSSFLAYLISLNIGILEYPLKYTHGVEVHVSNPSTEDAEAG